MILVSKITKSVENRPESDRKKILTSLDMEKFWNIFINAEPETRTKIMELLHAENYTLNDVPI